MKDEDLCLVDYKPFRHADDLGQSEVSLCFVDPFVEGKLNYLGTNASTYVKHLSGEHFEKHLKNVNYTDVTFNLREYYIGWRFPSGNKKIWKSEKDVIYSMGGSFMYGMFRQCFTLDSKKLDMQNVKYVQHTFHPALFLI
jgi:hypothetical protein